MAGARRKGLNQDLQNWGIGRIRAVVGNSSVVQTVRPEIDQETDCKTIGVRQPKIGDRPNLMGCGPEWGCVSGYLRATTPDAGCTPRWHGRRKFMPSLQSQGDRADGPPRAVGKDTSRTSRGGQIFLLYYKCPLWPLTPPPFYYYAKPGAGRHLSSRRGRSCASREAVPAGKRPRECSGGAPPDFCAGWQL